MNVPEGDRAIRWVAASCVAAMRWERSSTPTVTRSSLPGPLLLLRSVLRALAARRLSSPSLPTRCRKRNSLDVGARALSRGNCGKEEARRYPYVAARLVLRLILVVGVVVVTIVGRLVEFALGRGGWRELGRTHGVDGGEERRVGTEVRATGRKCGPRVERRNASGRRGDARVRSSSSSSRLCGHDW
jgi:hypothetical protein